MKAGNPRYDPNLYFVSEKQAQKGEVICLRPHGSRRRAEATKPWSGAFLTLHVYYGNQKLGWGTSFVPELTDQFTTLSLLSMGAVST